MENHHDHRRHHSSATNNRSISDTDSQFDDFHSPLRSDSPLSSDDFPSAPSKAIVSVDKYSTNFRSPISNLQKPPQTVNLAPPAKAQSPVVVYSRSAREESVAGVANKIGTGGLEDGSGGGGGGVGGERKSKAAAASILRRPRKEVTIERAALGFRVCEVILSLIAFSVMASDKTQGWSGDSFDRYKEYRYLVAVNAIAFAYATFQAIDLTFHLINGRRIISYSLRSHFDFLIDQILAYLLISASSSAATRVDDWVSNWGKDEFTIMATASIGMSFLAFLAFALSSLISGYNLFNHTSF